MDPNDQFYSPLPDDVRMAMLQQCLAGYGIDIPTTIGNAPINTPSGTWTVLVNITPYGDCIKFAPPIEMIPKAIPYILSHIEYPFSCPQGTGVVLGPDGGVAIIVHTQQMITVKTPAGVGEVLRIILNFPA